jgi:hypothetical protein
VAVVPNVTLVATPNPTSVTLGTTATILKDSAVLSGGYYETGTITFTLYLGSTLLDTETVTANGNGTYTTPTSYTMSTTGTVTGTYQWNVSYNGNGNNNSVSENNNAAEQVVVSQGGPTLVATPNPTTVTLGTTASTLKDSVVLSGASNPTGTITFTLYLGSTLLDTETVTVNGNGSYSTPTGYTLPSTGTVTGTYQWNVTYSGNANNNPASENNNSAEQVVVSKAGPTLVATPNPTTVTLGATATTLKDSAVLSGGSNPTGTVTFTLYLGSTLLDTETVAVSGSGTYSTPTGYALATTGVYQWNAAYTGDANNTIVSENNNTAEQVVVIPAAPTFTGPAASTTSTTPAFSWTATPGATQYDLWVNDVTTGQSQVIRQQTLTVNSYTPATPLPAGSYQATVRVTTAGGTSAWSAAYSFSIILPAIPTLTAPTGSTANPTPVFTWTASAGAALYDLSVNNLTTGQVQIIRQQTLTTNSYTPSALLPAGSYTAWVQAINSAGNSAGWSAGLNFTITGPVPPTMTAPVGASVNITPTFTWTASGGATRYDLWVSDLTTGQYPILRQQNLLTNSYTPAVPLTVGSYTAWVQAYNGTVALGNWSAGSSFTIVAPAAPTLTGPATTITTTTPTFTWTASAGATQYQVWAENTTTGQNPVVNQTVTTTSYTPAAAIPRGQYFFWVRAANSAGAYGPWSAAYQFLIDTTAPAIPTITGPVASTSSLTPTITWSASAGAARYDLWVNNTTTGQIEIIRQQTLATNSFTPVAPLPVGIYTAWVEAFDNTNQTRGWSATYFFTITPPAAPAQLAPSGSISNSLPTFSWGAVANAVRYELWVDDVTTSQSPVIDQQNLAANAFTPSTALAKGNYRFWVRAFNANGNAGNWSSEVDFTIM